MEIKNMKNTGQSAGPLRRIEASRQGFTLLETLITVAVIALMSSLIVQVFFTTTHTNTKTEVLKEVKQNGDFALDVMTRMIRNASSVSSDCTGATAETLDITNPDGGSTSFGCTYDGVNKVTRIASTSASTNYLTNTDISLGGTACPGSLKFTCTPSYFNDKIKIEFTLIQRGNPTSQFELAQMPFEVTISTRN
jgi:prepilin-type N-terminal cleavage/methylation domain-containing protein